MKVLLDQMPGLPVPGWRSRAACRSADGQVFFGPEGETDDARAVREAQAKAICRGCPVRGSCLEYALLTHPEHGIWGGISAGEIPQVWHRRKHYRIRMRGAAA